MLKKYTRKQLKKPDEFISFSVHVWQWIGERVAQVLIMFGVVILITASAYGWNYYTTNRAKTVTAYFTKANDIYQKPLWSGEGNFAPPTDDGIPQFKSRKEKMENIEKVLVEAEGKSSSVLRSFAILLKAGALFDQNKFEEAAAVYQQYLDKSKDHRFDSLAIEGLAYCFEAQKNFDRAIEFVRKLPQEGEKKYEAIYQEARLLARKGQNKEAAKLFEEVMNKAASTALQDRASEQIVALEK